MSDGLIGVKVTRARSVLQELVDYCEHDGPMKKRKSKSSILPADPDPAQNRPFDLIKITHSRRECSLSPNTVRVFFKQGLPSYKVGKLLFFSRTELETFIKSHLVTRSHLESHPEKQEKQNNIKQPVNIGSLGSSIGRAVDS